MILYYLDLFDIPPPKNKTELNINLLYTDMSCRMV